MNFRLLFPLIVLTLLSGCSYLTVDEPSTVTERYDPVLTAISISNSSLMDEFATLLNRMEGFKPGFSLEELNEWGNTTNPSDAETISFLAKRSNLSISELDLIKAELQHLSNTLNKEYGEAIKHFYRNPELKELYHATLFKHGTTSLGNEKSSTPCGIGYDLSCEGTSDCYYGNNLDTYLDTCEDRAIDVAWIILEGGVITGTVVGGGVGSVVGGVGAGPGAVVGGLLGLFGGLVAAHVSFEADLRKCRMTLAELCAGCLARCDIP